MEKAAYPRFRKFWNITIGDDSMGVEPATASKNTELTVLGLVCSATLILEMKLLEEEDELPLESVELKGWMWLAGHHRGGRGPPN